ncbi:MBOAT family O-acyltransferase [Cohnella faecalis]|uniref:MBOAT family protein n=1 Tax=Cohnella faecalis TaxID=2315694 RepID=A0A398CJY2_9BACL|nr:MBOAT family O-acyltransferase [Cohnella faecalis]RIE02655.1 MBOAT family protein [Cohnella faecalis]
MIFSSIEYIVFLCVVILSIALLKTNQLKKIFLLVASYFFYAWWDWRFTALMFLLSFVNYQIAIQIERTSTRKKYWLIISVVFNLVILGFFKYFNFFIDSANQLLNEFGTSLPLLSIILPVGISFITFEVMSYVIDVYRGENKSSKSFIDLALLVSFFPHLIAGPILKPKHFLPQLKEEIKIRASNIITGSQIFIFGLIKKLLIADRLAYFVDPVFANPQQYSSSTVWLAVIAYAIQIYCDFSGYSDMAIGSAKMLGFDIPKNFNLPYLSRNVTEFWRRWHISLSSWLREYLYFSLGGNRKGKAMTYINLIIVMVLGGLWHGASWNFVIWGMLHGIGLVVHKLFMKIKFERSYIAYSFFSWLITFLFICITWVFFRSSDFSVSSQIINKLLFVSSGGTIWYATSLIAIIPIVIAAHFIGKKINNYLVVDIFSFKGLFLLSFVIVGIVILLPGNSSPFIYFQF